MDPANRAGGASAPPYCSQCGSRLGPSAKFCPQCGVRIGERTGTSADRRTTGARTNRSPAARGTRDADDGTAHPGWNWPPADGAEARGGRWANSRGTTSRPDERREDSASDRWDSTVTDGRHSDDSEGTHPRRGPDERARSDLDEGARRLRERIETYVRDGWSVDEYDGDYAVLVDRSYGSGTMHLLVALTTVWWTSGLGNVVYAAYKYHSDAETRILTVRDGPEGQVVTERLESTSSSNGFRIAGFLFGLLLVFMLLLFMLALLVGFGELSLVVFVGVVLVVGGLAAVVGRSGDHSPTEFGRTRTVSERAVRRPERPCTACLSPVDRGVERTYRDEFVVAGVALKTYDVGRNHYCHDCAQGEVVEPNAETDDADGGSETTPDEREEGVERDHGEDREDERTSEDESASVDECTSEDGPASEDESEEGDGPDQSVGTDGDDQRTTDSDYETEESTD